MVLVAMTADAPQIDVPAAMSCASLGSTSPSSSIQIVKAKQIPITMERVSGLNVAMPASCLMANAAPAITHFRNRSDRNSRGLRPNHRWMVGWRRTSFSDAASLVLEIKVMSWLLGLPTQYRLSLPINLTDNTCKTNRFNRSTLTLAGGTIDGAGSMPNPVTAIVTDSTRQVSNGSRILHALSHARIRPSGQDRHCRASSNALKITAPRRAPNRPSTAILRGDPI